MRIGVLADSHDNLPMVERAVELFNTHNVEQVLHAGDFVAPFAVHPLAGLRCPVLAVLGNNDGERQGLERAFEAIGELHPYLATTTLAGRRIAVVHYPDLAERMAESRAFDLVVFGHTHEIDLRRRHGLLLNPGETGGWLSGRATAALVDLATLDVEIHDLDGSVTSTQTIGSDPAF